MAALGQIRKALVASVTFGAAVAATGLLHGQAQTYVVALVSVAGVFGIYATPNKVSGVEQRLADLEASIPGLPDLTQSIGDVVTGGIVQAFKHVTAAPVAVAPQAQVEAAAEKAAEKVLRDARGRFIGGAR